MKKYIIGYAVFSIVMLIIGLTAEYINAVSAANKAYSTLHWFIEAWQFSVFLPSFPLLITFLLYLVDLTKKIFLKIKGDKQFTISNKLQKRISSLKIVTIAISIFITFMITTATFRGIQTQNIGHGFWKGYDKFMSFAMFPIIGAIVGVICATICLIVFYAYERKNIKKS